MYRVLSLFFSLATSSCCAIESNDFIFLSGWICKKSRRFENKDKKIFVLLKIRIITKCRISSWFSSFQMVYWSDGFNPLFHIVIVFFHLIFVSNGFILFQFRSHSNSIHSFQNISDTVQPRLSGLPSTGHFIFLLLLVHLIKINNVKKSISFCFGYLIP